MARPKATDPQVNFGIYGKKSELDYLLTWNNGSSTLAMSELIEELKRVRPGGRHSGPKIDPEARNRPGTKTSLKREIRDLQAQAAAYAQALTAAGIDPATIKPKPPRRKRYFAAQPRPE